MCSNHFADGEPTVTHLFAELKLCYEKQMLKLRKEITKHHILPQRAKKYIAEETVQTSPPFRTPPHENQEHYPEFPPKHRYCLLLVVKNEVVAFINPH